MKCGARNQIRARLTSVKTGTVMALVRCDVTMPAQMASVTMAESAADLDLKVGDEVLLVVKAIHVLPVKPFRSAGQAADREPLSLGIFALWRRSAERSPAGGREYGS